MNLRFVSLSAVGALMVAAGVANADTVATFADPSPGPGTPVFALTGNTLSGSWSGLGLNLLTPGTPAADFSDVTFVMTPLLVTPIVPGFALTSGGQIDFFDGMVNIFTIQFDAGTLTSPSGFGGSDFVGQNVRFSGPVLAGLISVNEAFAFSFANPVATQTGYTVTSAFTSSADLRVPGPASLAGLACGLLAVGRRRRA